MTKLTEKNKVKIEGNVKNNWGIVTNTGEKCHAFFFLIDIDFKIKLSYDLKF